MNFFVVFEMYNNPNEYSSANQILPIAQAVCTSLKEAAEVVALIKINDLQRIIDNHTKGNYTRSSLTYDKDLFVVKVSPNETFSAMNLPRQSLSNDMLTDETAKLLSATQSSFNQSTGGTLKSTVKENINLKVDPSAYERDRKARESEMMKRWNVAPLQYKNSVAGTVPQPAKPIMVRQAQAQTLKVAPTNNSYSESELNTNNPGTVTNTPVAQPTTVVPVTNSATVPTWQSTPYASISAPVRTPEVNPVASEVPNPITTPVPLTPVGGGIGGINNITTNSAGEIYASPPNNTATSATSRITGI